MSLLTPRDVAEHCSLGYRTVLRAIEDGELAAFRLRGQLRVLEEDLDDWLYVNRVEPRAPVEVPAPTRKEVGRLP